MKELTDFWVDGIREPERMWASWEDPHRKQILVAIGLLPRKCYTVYEIGCGSGPNLRLVKDKFPDVTVSGSEPNQHLAAWAREHLQATIDQYPFPFVSLEHHDVTISCYALAYAEEQTVRETMKALRSHYLILVEPQARLDPFGDPGLYRGHAMPSYVHDYFHLAQQCAWRPLWRWPFIPHHQGLNQVLILER